MAELIEGFVPYREEDVSAYRRHRWWADLTLGDMFDRAADIQPDKEAFVDCKTRLTYGQARERTNRLAIGLMDLGIRPLQRVLLQLPNWNEFVFAYFALQKIGAIPVLLIDRYRPFEIDRLIRLTGATGWIVAAQYGKTDFQPIIADVLEQRPELEHVITVRGEIDGSIITTLEALIAQTQLNEENLARLAEQRPDPMQVAHMAPTGGTTGEPKIVPRTHNSLVTCVEYCTKAWEQHCQDVNLLVGPIGHDLTFTKGFLGSIGTLGRCVFLDSTDTRDICETIERERVTSIIWVPTLAKRLIEYEDLNRYELSCLQKMHSGGGASHPHMIHEITERLKMKFYNGYGATEGMTTITRTTDPLDVICGTVGSPTCPYDTYRVIDFSGNSLPVGRQGELVLKGPGVFTGYFNNIEENFLAFTEDGYFRTGDLARIDSRGYITITGRIKQMINRGGESISATEIEKLISRHQDVVAVAVIPMSDPVMGEKVCAYIQPRDGISLTFEAIIEFLKEQKASVLQFPERIEFIDAMPYTKAHKTDRKKLREDIERKLQASA